MTDDEVRALGYTHRDADGYWQRSEPEPLRPYGAEPTSMRASADEAMVRGLLDAHDGDIAKATVDWQAIKAETDAQVARDLEAAKNWQPKVTVGPLTPGERVQLNRLLAGRLKNKRTAEPVKRRREDATKGANYVVAALEREADAVRSAPHGMRNIVLAESAWTLTRPELAGLVDAATIQDVLVSAGVDAGLPEREARSVVRRAIRKRGAS